MHRRVHRYPVATGHLPFRAKSDRPDVGTTHGKHFVSIRAGTAWSHLSLHVSPHLPRARTISPSLSGNLESYRVFQYHSRLYMPSQPLHLMWCQSESRELGVLAYGLLFRNVTLLDCNNPEDKSNGDRVVRAWFQV